MLFQIQIQNLEREIQEKKRQMMILEQRMMECGEASFANASIVDMQQVLILSSSYFSSLSFLSFSYSTFKRWYSLYYHLQVGD